MFMLGPFMRFAFMDVRSGTAGDIRLVGASVSTGQLRTSTSWDDTLSEDNSPIAYFAIIEPWVLADRS